MTPRDPTPGHNKAVEHDGHVPTPGGTRPVSARPEDVVREARAAATHLANHAHRTAPERRLTAADVTRLEGVILRALAALVAERDEARQSLDGLTDVMNEERLALMDMERERDEWKARSEAASERAATWEAKAQNLAMQLGETRQALRDTLLEIDELGADYTRMRKKYEPPYVLYTPWSRPAALQAVGSEEHWPHGKFKP